MKLDPAQRAAQFSSAIGLPVASPPECPKCGDKPFRPFLRYMVARSNIWPWHWARRDVFALICWGCKDIVGYEE